MYSSRSKFVVWLLGCLCLGASTAPHNMSREETDPELTSGYFEGDMEVEFLRNGILAESRYWPNATVHYKIEEEFGDPHIAHIEIAMRIIESVSCIRFVPATAETVDYLLVKVSTAGCNSRVGCWGGEQILNLKPAPLDTGCFRLGSIQHELLHTLGFRHQQNSPNRDEFVKIMEENIIKGTEFNFKKYDDTELGDFGVPYDYSSILHYGPKGFSKNGEPTIVALDPKGQKKMGQRRALSDGDIIRLNTMYKCPLQV